MLLKMYRNRIKAYRKMAYTIEEPSNLIGRVKVRTNLMAIPTEAGPG
jgi:hypothetical protein